ncbi:META domain-containing protein [Litchfieldella rifensis]|uniref:META domain-containing protein n=1 Tax=Litchfieldella rifensis TaxID=762643 RepID=A0ABV7LK36_9GAMM
MKGSWVAIGLVAVLLSGCAGSSPPAPQREQAAMDVADSPVIGPRWRLILLGTDERWSGNQPAWFEVAPEGGTLRLVGSDGCNRLSGQVELDDGNRIRIQNLASTRMACPNMAEAQRANALLENAYRYLIDDDRLVFFGRDSRVLGGFQRTSAR